MATKRQIQVAIDPTQAEAGAQRLVAAEKSVKDAILAAAAALTNLDAAQHQVAESAQEVAVGEAKATTASKEGAAAATALTAATTALVVAGTRGVQTTKESVGWTQRQSLVLYEATAAQRAYSSAVVTSATGTFSLSRALQGFLAGFSAVAIVRGVTQELAGLETVQARLRAVSEERDSTDFAKLGEQAKEFGENSIFTAKTVTEAQLELAKANFTVAESLAIVPNVLNLATSETLALGEASKITAETLSKFKLPASDAARVVDDLVIAANKSTTSVPAIAEALATVGPIARQLNVPLEETVGLIASISNVAQGSEAGTALRGILASLIDPTTEGKQVLEDLGLTIDDVNPKVHGLTNVLEELRTRGLSEQQVFQLFRREAATVAIALINNTDAARDLTQAQKDLAGQAARTATEISDTLGGAMLRFKATVASVVDSTGEGGLGSTLRGIVEFGSDVIKVMNNGRVEGDGYNAVLKGLVATGTILIGTRVALAIGTWATAMRAAAIAGTSLNGALLTNPYVLAATAVVGLVVAVDSLAESWGKASEAQEKHFALQEKQKGKSGLTGADVASATIGIPALSGSRAGLGPEAKVALDALEKRISGILEASAPGFDTKSGQFQDVGTLPDELVRGLFEDVRALFDQVKKDAGPEAEAIAQLIRDRFVTGIQKSGLRDDLKNEFDVAFKNVDAAPKAVPFKADKDDVERAENLLSALKREIELTGLSSEARKKAELGAQAAAAAVKAYGDNTAQTSSFLVEFASNLDELTKKQRDNAEATQATADANQRLEESRAAREALVGLLRDLEREEALIGATTEKKREAAQAAQVAAIAEAAFGSSVGAASDFVAEYTKRLEALGKAAQDAARKTKTDALGQEIDDLSFRKSTAGLDDEERRIREQVRDFERRSVEAFGNDAEAAAAQTKRFEHELRDLAKTEKEWERVSNIAEGTANSLGGAIHGLADNLLSGRDAFVSITDAALNFGKAVALGVFDETVTKPVVKATSGFLKNQIGDFLGLGAQEGNAAETESTSLQSINAATVAIQAGSVTVTGGTTGGTGEGAGFLASLFSFGSGGKGGEAEGQVGDTAGEAFSFAGHPTQNDGTGKGGLESGYDKQLQTQFKTLPFIGQLQDSTGYINPQTGKSVTYGDVFSGGFGGLSFGKGAAFDRGRVVAFAGGGYVDEPTMFPMHGGNTGLMGESGPEAIIPLERGRGGKLGIASHGVGGNTYNNTFIIKTPDVRGFNASKGSIAAKQRRDDERNAAKR